MTDLKACIREQERQKQVELNGNMVPTRQGESILTSCK